MAFSRQYACFCVFLVATMAAMCQSGQGQGQELEVEQDRERELLSLNLNLNLNLGLDICRKADFPALCRSVVKGAKVPSEATEATIKKLMFETKMAMATAQRRRSHSQAMDVCLENYDDAYSNLETCLSNLDSHDKPSLNINLSAALTDYVTCDDAVAEEGEASPVTRTNEMLREMASNGLFLSSLIRFH